MKSFKQIIFGLCMLTLVFGMFSCQKGEVEPEEALTEFVAEPDKNPTNFTEVYFLDGQRVQERSYDLEDPSLEIIVVGRQISQNDAVLEYNAYTTLQGLYNYGRANNIPIQETDQKEEQLVAYAESSGAITEYEQTGQVPSHFESYQQRILGPAGKNDALTCWWARECVWAQWIAWKHTPALPGSWNNRISIFEMWGINGMNYLYDRTFYRSRMLRYWTWGVKRICLENQFTHANNRTSSFICI